jgi:hypothetical protein
MGGFMHGCIMRSRPAAASKFVRPLVQPRTAFFCSSVAHLMCSSSPACWQKSKIKSARWSRERTALLMSLMQ